MKLNLLVLLSFLLIVCNCFSQKENNFQKWQIVIQANTVEKLPSVAGLFVPEEKYVWGSDINKSYCLGLTTNYFLKENFLVRLKIDYLNRNIIQKQETMLMIQLQQGEI